MRHTLGLDRGTVAYRNHFAASDGHSDMPALDLAVERGWMVRETSAISPGYIFRVTATGRSALESDDG